MNGGTVKNTTSYAVITERFAVLADYLPDAFYKRLILAVEDDGNGNYVGSKNNIITFYYSKNDSNAFYAVHYMLQNADATSVSIEKDENGKYINFTESDTLTEGIGLIGSKHNITPQTFSGFSVLDEAYIDGTAATPLVRDDSNHPYFTVSVTAEGTELYIFYERNDQNYKVYYLRHGTDISNLSSLDYDPDDSEHSNGVLLPIDSGTAKYGTTVTVSSKPVGGMSCVSSPSQSIVMRGDNAQNYIVFFYSPLQFTVEYKVWEIGGGELDREIEVVNGTDSFKGSTATAKDGYVFEGWYLDKNCTVPVVSDPPSDTDKATVSGSTITPITLNLADIPATNVFYAKFTPVQGNLTINRQNAADEGGGTGTFVYKITSTDQSGFEMYVTVTGNGSVTVKGIPCREYKIEQIGSWSWRYSDKPQTVTVNENETVSVTFGEKEKNGKWLNANADVPKNKRG